MTRWKRQPLSSATLAAYLEGALSAAERALVEATLEKDAEARARLKQLAHVRAALHADAHEVEGVDLVERVRANVRLGTKRKP